MKKLFYALAVLMLVGGSMSVAAAAPVSPAEAPAASPSAETISESPATQQAVSQEPVSQGSISGNAGGAQEAGIFCAVTCEDGTGLAYTCKLGNFPDCCQVGEDGCWAYHGGPDYGTCWQGGVSYTCDGI